MIYTKKLYLALWLLWTFSLLSNGYSFAQQRQNFTSSDVRIPQEIVTTSFASNQCKVLSHGSLVEKTYAYAMYDKQHAALYDTLLAANSTILKIYNDKNFSLWSSRVFIYNPLGILSTATTLGWLNSFIPDFPLKSHLKPKGIDAVYATWQNNTGTYFVGTSALARADLAGQVAFSIMRREFFDKKAGQCAGTTAILNGVSCLAPTLYSWLPFTNPTSQQQKTLDLMSYTAYKRTDGGENPCLNFYVARCGDNVVDNPSKTGDAQTDGKNGIATRIWFISWFSPTFTWEVCDDGGAPGGCNDTCTGLEGGYCGDWIPQTTPQEDLNKDGNIDENDVEWCDYGADNNSERSDCSATCSIIPSVEPEVLREEVIEDAI